MSSEFYFKKWKQTLACLEDIVNLDLGYQTAHDKNECEASLRLSAILGQYKMIYNRVMECKQENLQVQKTEYIDEAVKVVVNRMIELKHELTKLESCEHNFLNNGLIFDKLTSYDSELTEVPGKIKRPDEIQRMIEEVIEKANERKIRIEEQKRFEERGISEEHVDNWWEEALVEERESKEDFPIEEKKKVLTEEEIETKRFVEIIQAHEKNRQVITWRNKAIIKRQKWVKDIEGTSAPQAPYETRERCAAVVQKVCRAYFKCKRQRCLDCKRDELLDMRLCLKPKKDAQDKLEQVKAKKPKLKDQYEKAWKTDFEIIKENYRKWKGDELCESYRDHVRDWFHIWFEGIKLFYDIPDDKVGGSKLILKEELPTPEEYLEEYKAYMAEKKSKKNKSALQLKYEKMAAKKQEEIEKQMELQKKKQEKEMKTKMLKNPTKHPGFDYPGSKKTEHIIKAIEEYHTDWDRFDETEELEFKERHSKEVNKNKAIKEVAIEVIPQVDEVMRVELKKLKVALKKDYIANEMEMLEPMKKIRKKQKKKRTPKTTSNEKLAEYMEDLVFQGFIQEYPKTKLEEFIGDPNFAGDDIRCNYGSALPMHGETRSLWWEKCREATLGFHKILLVGPKGGGKTLLINALASLNDAILFVLDLNLIRSELASDVYLQQIVQYVVSCAKAAQPSVIYIKHVHRFYYKKKPPEEAEVNLELFKRHFTKKLFKKIHKADKITVIATCVDPWTTKSKMMLKKFPNVVLMPNTNYSTVVQLLNQWVLSNHAVPSDFSVSCLAHALQGYSFGYLKEFLERFMSAERIAWISINGLSPDDVYNSVLEEGVEKTDYAKYLKWFTERTPWGKKEKQHFDEQREFKKALEKWALRKEMKKQKAAKKLETKPDTEEALNA